MQQTLESYKLIDLTAWIIQEPVASTCEYNPAIIALLKWNSTLKQNYIDILRK